MRHFLRHSSDMPVEIRLRKQKVIPKQRLHNISLGGVACNCGRAFRRGTAIDLLIPLLGDDAHYQGVVAWCRKQTDDYLVGIAFVDEDALFRARLVEQVCQIEGYRQTCEKVQGRHLSIELAAEEWISQYAAGFKM